MNHFPRSRSIKSILMIPPLAIGATLSGCSTDQTMEMNCAEQDNVNLCVELDHSGSNGFYGSATLKVAGHVEYEFNPALCDVSGCASFVSKPDAASSFGTISIDVNGDPVLSGTQATANSDEPKTEQYTMTPLLGCSDLQPDDEVSFRVQARYSNEVGSGSFEAETVPVRASRYCDFGL